MIYFHFYNYVKLENVIAANHEHNVNQTLQIFLLSFFILENYLQKIFYKKLQAEFLISI